MSERGWRSTMTHMKKLPAPEPYTGDGSIKWEPGDYLAIPASELYKGMVLRMENRPGGESWIARVADVVDNKDGTVTLTTEPVDDHWQPVTYELTNDENPAPPEGEAGQ